MMNKATLRSDLGDSFAKHLSDKHWDQHRGALFVSDKGTAYLCLFGNDDYGSPRTKTYVEKLKSNVLITSQMFDADVLWGVDNESGAWVIAIRCVKIRASRMEPVVAVASSLVWDAFWEVVSDSGVRNEQA